MSEKDHSMYREPFARQIIADLTAQLANVTVESADSDRHYLLLQACFDKVEKERDELKAFRDKKESQPFGKTWAELTSELKAVKQERNELKEKLADWEDNQKSVMDETCVDSDDRLHCTCVPTYKRIVKEQAAEINALKCRIEGDHCSMCPEIASLKADAKELRKNVRLHLIHHEHGCAYLGHEDDYKEDEV